MRPYDITSATPHHDPSSLFYCSGDHRDLHSFPTRRSSDLIFIAHGQLIITQCSRCHGRVAHRSAHHHSCVATDRKSTRLNSSHPSISYAVFCLKKKKRELTPGHLYIRRHPARPLIAYLVSS